MSDGPIGPGCRCAAGEASGEVTPHQGSVNICIIRHPGDREGTVVCALRNEIEYRGKTAVRCCLPAATGCHRRRPNALPGGSPGPGTVRAVPIVPDEKNWTWVLEREYPECGFDALGQDGDAAATDPRERGDVGGAAG
jgi:hypothetical protein